MSIARELEAAGERLSPAVRAALARLEEENGHLRKLLEEAYARIRELERRLGLDSTNSSKPPSSDPPGTVRAPKKRKGAKRRGAQPGHEAHQRALVPVERVDRIENHWPTACGSCGHRFALFAEHGRPERRQVIECPPLRAEVSEHRLHSVSCEVCHAVTKAEAPPGVSGQTTFGPRLAALGATLTVRLRSSRRNVQRVLDDLLDTEPPSLGTLQHLLEEASAALLPAYREVRAAVRGSGAVGADETGWTLRRLRYWLWVAATPTLSFYRLARRRSARQRERLLGKGYSGVVTSDRYSAYRGLLAERRQLCWAHLRRDFEGWQARGESAAALGRWAAREHDRLFHLWHRFQAGELTRSELRSRLRPLQARFTRLLYRAYLDDDAKVARTADRLLALWPALWSFAEHEGVQPTNNRAEQALRAGVIWRKTSFGSNSGRGLRIVERLLTVAETAKKRQRDLLPYLATALTAYRQGATPPALLITTS